PYHSTLPHTRLPPFPTRRSSDLDTNGLGFSGSGNRNVGAWTLTLAHDATDNNGYTINYFDGALTISKKDLNVSGLTGVVSKTYEDRKSTRLNSSHLGISYAVFCL